MLEVVAAVVAAVVTLGGISVIGLIGVYLLGYILAAYIIYHHNYNRYEGDVWQAGWSMVVALIWPALIPVWLLSQIARPKGDY